MTNVSTGRVLTAAEVAALPWSVTSSGPSDLTVRRALVDELGAARDEIGRLGMPGASFVDRDAVLGLLRDRIDGRVHGQL